MDNIEQKRKSAYSKGQKRMTIPGNLLTTAMAVMPHDNENKALETALTLDIPFWPQLPNLRYYEDMYVQASENFPGIVLDIENKRLSFSMDKFIEEFEAALKKMEEPYAMEISETYSSVYHKFLKMDLSKFKSIHGQIEGPISFGFNIPDQNKRPILFDDTIRPFILEFMAKKINIQLKRLKEKNENAFMFVDEPGLQFLFSAMSGYDNITAKKDMENFFSLIERPRGVHLCGNPDWDFLLTLDLDILSLDTYTNRDIIASYAGSFKKFIERGGTVVWGIVPTNYEPFNKESMSSLESLLSGVWDSVLKAGLDRGTLLSRSLLSPAMCCLINPDRERTVDNAFKLIRQISQNLRERWL